EGMDRFTEALGLLTPKRTALVLIAGCGAPRGSGWPRWGLIKVAEVSQLWIYPVKSCRGAALTLAECSQLGLGSGPLKDRHWIIVDEACHMITGRVQPSLVLVSVSKKNDDLCLNATGMQELRIPFELPKSNPIFKTYAFCRVFQTDIEGRDCGDKAAEWITTYLKNTQPFRLMSYEPTMKPRRSKNNMKTGCFYSFLQIAYSDLSACMLLSEASVEDLNTRLEKKVKVENFRPVIVVKDCEPYKEVNRFFYIDRCIFTTVDPDTGIISRKEPLQTLKSYRQCDPSEKHIYKSDALFGVHFRIDETGVIQVGDPVYKIC
uniref:MOSC domain-containing protein n=1 Tax=Callorhinchus milii TaxID=7868 RepID=A0A4W3IBG8_CALMI